MGRVASGRSLSERGLPGYGPPERTLFEHAFFAQVLLVTFSLMAVFASNASDLELYNQLKSSNKMFLARKLFFIDSIGIYNFYDIGKYSNSTPFVRKMLTLAWGNSCAVPNPKSREMHLKSFVRENTARFNQMFLEFFLPHTTPLNDVSVEEAQFLATYFDCLHLGFGPESRSKEFSESERKLLAQGLSLAAKVESTFGYEELAWTFKFPLLRSLAPTHFLNSAHIILVRGGNQGFLRLEFLKLPNLKNPHDLAATKIKDPAAVDENTAYQPGFIVHVPLSYDMELKLLPSAGGSLQFFVLRNSLELYTKHFAQ